MRMPVRQLSLGIVLAALASTLALGLVQKAPCASGIWPDVKQYRLLCYSDIVPLYGSEDLQGNRLPYLDDCHATQAHVCDEYPVLTMYTMRLAAWSANQQTELGDRYLWFFYGNALLLAVAAVATAAALHRMAGRRALYFALAPTLLVYAFLNWDLIAVAFATAGTLAFLRKRDTASGILLGLGTAAKLYPALFLVPFAAERLRAKDKEGAARLVVWGAAGWMMVNFPFMLLAQDPWTFFFRFNANYRGADWDSLWYIGCDRLQSGTCLSTDSINLLSIVAFVALSLILCGLRLWRDRDTPLWQLAFPILVAFLLTNKVYSPQYSLWLLPWFALALPDLRLFIAFEASDIAVFVTRFAFFGEMAEGSHGWVDAFTFGFFEISILVRTAILLVCLAVFVARAPAGPRAPVQQQLVTV
jgi:uncharacterized membrane protein